MKPGAFQVCVKDNWNLSEKLQLAAFKAGYLWAGVGKDISGRHASWLIFKTQADGSNHIYYASRSEHQPEYGPEISSAEAFRRFIRVDFQGIDCTIPEGD